MSGADMSEANMSEANMSGANMSEADMRWANMSEADMSEAEKIMSFQAGNLNRVCYAVKHENCVMFQLGCFWGTSTEAIKAINKKYGKGSSYVKLIRLYTKILNEET